MSTTTRSSRVVAERALVREGKKLVRYGYQVRTVPVHSEGQANRFVEELIELSFAYRDQQRGEKQPC